MISKLERLYEAASRNDGVMVSKILCENKLSTIKIPTNHIAGILVISAEQGWDNAVREIICYNMKCFDKIPHKYICGALKAGNIRAANQDARQSQTVLH